jgi:hypothetical protein
VNPATRKPEPPSHQDRLQSETLRAAVTAPGGLVDQFKRMTVTDPNRSIRSLKMVELEAIACGTIGAWVSARSQVEKREWPNSLEAFLAEMQPPTSPAIEDFL